MLAGFCPTVTDSSDVVAMERAKAALGVGEFEIFVQAYRWRDGKAPEGARLDRLFVSYLNTQMLPPAVRHYCREVEAGAASGKSFPPDAHGVMGTKRPQASSRRLRLPLDLCFSAFWLALFLADRLLL